MNQSDTISVIVPIYNVKQYIRRCVDSIINQSYKELEIILVDDGSSDGGGALCDEYAAKDSRIKVIHKKNAGLGFARNSGLDTAAGTYVTFIDGDDYIGPDHIKAMRDLVLRTGADTCIGGYTKKSAYSEAVHPNVCAGSVFSEHVKEEILPRMCGADSTGKDYIEMSVCMVLLSNKIIKENNLRFVSERELISEDFVFDFEYYPHSQKVCCGEMVDYFYCDNKGSLTTRYRLDRLKSQVVLYDYILEKAQELHIADLCKPRLDHTLLAIARYAVKLEYQFADENGIKTARDHVKRICNNERLGEVYARYDDRNIKLTSRIVNYLIKTKRFALLEAAMRIKNTFHV